MIPWCSHCRVVSPTVRDEGRGYICCQGCGKVLEHGTPGTRQSRLTRAYMRSVWSNYSRYHKRTSVSGAAMEHQTIRKSACKRSSEHKNLCNNAVDEHENLSDIEDAEVNSYLHNEMEKHFKKIIWEKMNKEYIKEQAAKEAAAAAAAKEACDANFMNDYGNLYYAKELATAATAAVARSRKERKQKRAVDAKRSTPAKTAAEATHQLLKRKTFSSKINYEALNALYKSEQEIVKKQHVESDTGDDDAEQQNGIEKIEKDLDSEVMGGDNDGNAPGDIFEEDYHYGGEYDDDDYNNGNEDEYDFY